jgi:hypothetical protein
VCECVSVCVCVYVCVCWHPKRVGRALATSCGQKGQV